LRKGDPTLPDLLRDDVRWWAPPGSHLFARRPSLYASQLRVIGA
jgi:hypothetical protein